MSNDHKAKCEAEHGTAHLPENVREAIWQVAYEHHHSCGVGEVVSMYSEYADPVLLAFQAGRAQVVTKLREWAAAMDHPNWRDGWMPEINAARTFAGQIESGSL
jgi:hypothetical protein